MAESSAVKEQHQCKKCNTSANYKSKFLNLIFSPQVSDWNVTKNFHKLPITNIKKFSEGFWSFLSISKHFQKFPKIFKNCRKIVLRTFRHFLFFSEDFRKFLKTSDNFWRFFSKIQKCWKVILSTSFVTNFWNFPKISEDIRWFHKFFFKCWKAVLSTLWHFLNFSKDFRRFPKTSEDFRRFSKISETWQNVYFCTLRCFLLSFPNEIFPNIQQRKHQPLLPVNWSTVKIFHVCY